MEGPIGLLWALGVLWGSYGAAMGSPMGPLGPLSPIAPIPSMGPMPPMGSLSHSYCNIYSYFSLKQTNKKILICIFKVRRQRA